MRDYTEIEEKKLAFEMAKLDMKNMGTYYISIHLEERYLYYLKLIRAN